MRSSLLLLLLLPLLALSQRTVFRVSLPTETSALRLASFAETHSLDLWTEPSHLLGHVDLLVPSPLHRDLLRLNLHTEIMIEDVDLLITQERERMKESSLRQAGFFEEYQTLDSINAWMDQLAKDHAGLVTLFSVGRTYEGREMRGVKIRANRGATKEFFFNGGIHSREWISPATTCYMINEMVTKYGRDANVTAMIDGLDWAIVPVLNPDGYVHTHTGDRLWRKNREPNSGSACAGTDLNRNWPFKWNTGGSSALPCSDAYHGPKAASAPETQAIVGYLNQNRARLAGYMDIHAYSQYLMYPWGYTTQLPPDNSLFKSVGDRAAAALSVPYGTRYQVGSIANIIYVASGSSVDFTYGELGIRWSYAWELRDTGRYGFLLPADQIVPSGIETFEALKVIALEGAMRG